MSFDWKQEYKNLAQKFIELHFSRSQRITEVFPCFRETYQWGKSRPQVSDSRVPAKNNTEYHGLERHALQYYATAQYEFAYHHWLIAAYWRWGDMQANGFNDPGHISAIRYAIKQAMFNKALSDWQSSPVMGKPPQPGEFNLSASDLDQKEAQTVDELETFDIRRKNKK